MPSEEQEREDMPSVESAFHGYHSEVWDRLILPLPSESDAGTETATTSHGASLDHFSQCDVMLASIFEATMELLDNDPIYTQYIPTAVSIIAGLRDEELKEEMGDPAYFATLIRIMKDLDTDMLEEEEWVAMILRAA